MPITIISNLSSPASGTANASSIVPEDTGASAFASLFLGQLLDAETLPGIDSDKRENRSGVFASALLSDDSGDDTFSQIGAATPIVPEIPVVPIFPSIPDILPSDVPETLPSGAPSTSALLTAATDVSLPETPLAAQAQAQPASGETFQRELENRAVVLPINVTQETSGNAAQMISPRTEAATFDTSAKIASAPAEFEAPSLAAITPSGAANTVNNAQLTISTPAGRTEWPDDFGQKIIWLAKNDRQSAQITLNPPHTGPIEVSLNLDKNTANAVFVSANPDIRESIESAIPRLREMFASAGIELGQAHVSAESFHQQKRDTNPEASRLGKDNAILSESSTGAPRIRSGILPSRKGFIDIFA
ncbi:MAG: flagellar hook-length control protein FliK [Candidatus Accumulibacter sp.]|jgi:flagellar hook-length control protein FliK|nr:flagellar hook-length control protein FliK [Accumulibacter sp.]